MVCHHLNVALLLSSVSSHEGEGWLKALQEANLATEVGLIVLDALGNFTTHCSDILTSDGAEIIMQQVFSLHLLYLQLGQSESLMKHVFASLRAFINNFPRTLFQGMILMCISCPRIVAKTFYSVSPVNLILFCLVLRYCWNYCKFYLLGIKYLVLLYQLIDKLNVTLVIICNSLSHVTYLAYYYMNLLSEINQWTSKEPYCLVLAVLN